ncbi:hypothetical protein [Hymenobacter cellulosilyticus]|uniref:DUF1579 domain-containing protein n=1 Tax=Hymenobacter cellulosilyticus TaxID=2932248 RepID=A0A8T9PYI6_9BACT|nr:hypothetical protein [Hymenobacter cellulosilyticus]UOQ70304.1 hypothetical protein MUN79_16285 [Hymenobacter cellulosilyticus]
MKKSLLGAEFWPTPAVTILFLSAALLLGACFPALAQSAPAGVTLPQLYPLTQAWQGSLTYLDYRSQKLVTLPTHMNGRQLAPRQLLLDFSYREPNGQQVAGTDTLELSADGQTISWDGTTLRVTQNTALFAAGGQSWQLVLEGAGQDNGKNCLIRKTVEYNAKQLIVRKEVKYAQEQAFLTRNTYTFQKNYPTSQQQP